MVVSIAPIAEHGEDIFAGRVQIQFTTLTRAIHSQTVKMVSPVNPKIGKSPNERFQFFWRRAS